MISQGAGYDTSDIPTSWALNMFRIDTPKGGRKVSIYPQESLDIQQQTQIFIFNNVGIQLLVL